MTAAVEQLPPPPDESVEFEVALDPAPAPFGGDPVRLAQVFTSLIYALRRELPLGETLRVEERRPPGLYEFRFGSAQTITAFDDHAGPQQPFDEWREGVGLSLPVARRIVEHHGGHLYAPPEGHKVGARLILPRTIS
jgi:signal transduction histidine kinase